MAKTKRNPAKAEMNMTPLIDVTFQLIIFFMLVNTIIAEETVKMRVPEPDEPQTRQLEEDIQKITVNIAPMPYDENTRPADRYLDFPGQALNVKIGNDRVFPKEDIAGIQAELERRLALAQPFLAEGEKVQVMLRADAALYYNEVQPVMAAITNAGNGRINLVAIMPEDQR